jgi:hypothetical protein
MKEPGGLNLGCGEGYHVFTGGCKKWCECGRIAHNDAFAVVQQSAPMLGEQSVTDAVVADMHARREFGRSKYGTELMSGNGRDALVDAYQEALDLVMYLKQAILERGGG